MLNNQTMGKLTEMLLTTMARNYKLQSEDAAFESLGFDERFGLLVDQEWTSRKNNRQKKLLQNAKFPFYDASIEGIEYLPDRQLDKAKITKLSSCNYITEFRNIVIVGATGSGKTYIANAFGTAACRNFYSVKYYRLSEFVAELQLAKNEKTYLKKLRRLKLVKLLILDDWLLYPLNAAEARDVLEIVEARYKKGSIIFCSQVDVGGWHQNLGSESVIADAILDRIAHESYKIVVAGNDSMRKRKGLQEDG